MLAYRNSYRKNCAPFVENLFLHSYKSETWMDFSMDLCARVEVAFSFIKPQLFLHR